MPHHFISWFRHASPYIKLHRDKTFVISIPAGIILSPHIIDIVQDIILLNTLGVKIIISLETTSMVKTYMTQHNLKVTDHETLKWIQDKISQLRFALEHCFSINVVSPIASTHHALISGSFISAKPCGIIDGIDMLYGGHIRSINAKTIRNIINNQDIALVIPLGYSPNGEGFYISATQLNLALSKALKIDKLILLVDTSAPINEFKYTPADARAELLKQNIPLRDDINTAIIACENGVKRCHILDSQENGVLLQELYTHNGIGLLITAEIYDQVVTAISDHIPQIKQLIQPLEEQGIIVSRSEQKLGADLEHFVVLLRDNFVIACAALYPFYSQKIAELACLVVDPQYHNHHCGQSLLEHLEKECRHKDIQRLFVLTTQATHWFIERGFKESHLEKLPVQRQQLYNYQRNSKVLIKDL